MQPGNQGTHFGRLSTHRISRVGCVLAALSLVAAAACGGDDDDTAGGADATSVSETELTQPSPVGTGGAAATTTPAASGEPWIVALTSDLDGPLSTFGQGHLAGLTTYVDYVNAQGGIHGRPIEVEARSDKSNVETGSLEFDEVLESDAIVSVGPLLSSLNAAVAPKAEEVGLSQFALTPAAELYDPRPEFLYTPIFTLDVSARIQIEVISQLAAEAGNTGPVKVAILRNDSASAEDFSAAAAAEIESRGWELMDEQVFATTGELDLSAQIQSLIGSGAEYCVCLVYAQNAVQAVRGLRSAGSDMPVVSIYNGGEPAVLSAIDDEGYYVVDPLIRPGDPDSEGAGRMRERAETAGQLDAHDQFGVNFTLGYVMGMVVEQALLECGSTCDRATFNESLRSVGEFDTDGLTDVARLDDDPFLTTSGKAYHLEPGADRPTALTDWISG